MRTVRSFDPCLPCGVHMYLGERQDARAAALAHPVRQRRVDRWATSHGRRDRPAGHRRPDRGAARRQRGPAARWRASAPRSSSGWSPTSTAPAWSGCSTSSHERGRLDDERPRALADDDLVAEPAAGARAAPVRRRDPGRAGAGRACGPTSGRTAATSSCSTSATRASSGCGCSAAATAARRRRSPSSSRSRARSRRPPRRSPRSRSRTRRARAGDGRPLIPVDSLRARLERAAAATTAPPGSRCRSSPTSRAGRGGRRRRSAGTPVLVCRLGADLFAFRDRCARCERLAARGRAGPPAGRRRRRRGAALPGLPGALRRTAGRACLDDDGAAPRPAAAADRRRRSARSPCRRRCRHERAMTAGGRSPLASLRRITTHPAGSRSPGERCEMCAEPIAEEHQHVVNLESRGADVHLPRLLPAVHRRARHAALPRRARPLPVVPRLRLRAGRLGRAADPGRPRLPLPATPRRTGWSRSTRARPAPPSPSCRWTPGSGSSSANPELRHAAARRRGAAGPRARTASIAGSAATWCRSTPATSWSGGCARCGAGSTAARRRAPRSTTFFADGRASAAGPRRREAGRAVSDLRVLRRRHLRRAVRRRAAADRAAADRGDHRPDDPRDRAALPGPDRAAAAPLRRGRRGRPARPVRRPGPVGRDAQAVPVDAVQRDGAGLHRHHRGRPAAAVHLRLRGHRLALPARRAATATIPLVAAVLRHRLHPGRQRVRGRAGAVGLRGAATAAGRGVAADDRRRTSRTPAGSGSTTTSSPRWPTTGPGTA